MGTAGIAGNHNGTFSLTFDSIYNRGATAARIEATGFNKTDGMTYGTLNQADDDYDFRIAGLYFANASNTCPIRTEVYVIPNSTVNIYTIDNIDIQDQTGSSCLNSYEGSNYSGLISVVDDATDGKNSRIIMSYTNGINSVFGYLTKQSFN